MTDESFDLPPIKPLAAPKHPLEVIRAFYVEHQERAQRGYAGGISLARCECEACSDAEPLLGVSR